jgi:peptide/nickel transport system permease protein
MAKYVLGRLGSTAVMFFAVTLLVFLAFYALPHDNVGRRAVPDDYRIHGSVLGGYAHYVWRIARHGDLGASFGDRERVTSRLFGAAPVTLSLVLGGTLVWLLISIPLGLLAALRPRSLLDRSATVFVLLGLSVHPAWLSLVLSYVFGHELRVVPADGYCSLANLSTGCDGLAQWSYHLVLPWITFGFVNAALFTTMVRSLVLEELREEYVRTAVAKGAGSFRIVRAHVLRNVVVPLATMLGITAGTALAGVVFVESAFNLPGLGGMLRQATLRGDLPLVAGSVLFFALAIVVLNLAVDVLYALVNPRIRVGARLRPRVALRVPRLGAKEERAVVANEPA